ncbi:MAG: class I SAM-dependent methyltransferase [Stenotrophomonas sp.]
MTIDAIDFNHLYRDHMAASGRQRKDAAHWDQRAGGFGPRRAHSHYADAFIARMNLEGCDSLLDVGCGNGALSLPLATRLRQVVALDYSRGMLEALRAGAAAQGSDNITPLLRAWEDDWQDVPVCDIVIASRSTQVEDMADALARLCAKARRRVYLTHRVGGHFIDPGILPAIGRRQVPPPDYIYILNILHGMGIHPRVDYLDGGAPVAVNGFDDLLQRVNGSLGALDAEETERLRHWHAGRVEQVPVLMPARRWAFIGWDVAGN